MNKASKLAIDDAALATNMNVLALDFIRELAMACRKLSIYGSDHPLAIKAVEKPFFALDRIYLFRNHVTLNLDGGILYALNIRLKDSLVTEEITRYLQVLEVRAIAIHRQVTIAEFAAFAERLAKRVDLSSHANLLSTFLEKRNITTIEVNSEKAFRLFETHKKYRGDTYGNFSVKNLALQQLGENPEDLADIDARGAAALDASGLDFTLEVVKYLLLEKFAGLPAQGITAVLADLAARIAAADEKPQREHLLQTYKSLQRLAAFHPRRQMILSEADRQLSADRRLSSMASELATPMGAIRVATSEQMDAILQRLLDGEGREYDANDFRPTFQRLLKTGQRAKASEIVTLLFDRLASADGLRRQRALDLLAGAITVLDLNADSDIFESAVGRVVNDLSRQIETFEYSEIMWSLSDKCLTCRRFDFLARLTAGMAQRRQMDRGVAIYDSLAVKRVFERLSRREAIDSLVDAMIKASFETSGYIREILIAIGSEEVAVALSHIISHPIRQVRQQALRVLAELGKAALKVSTQILMDDAMFERESGRQELPDGKWYIVRNSIFVLGSLADPDGLPALRLRLNDSDVRVRREIISALEKIGGDDACDVLILMAHDSIREIRESAVAAIGTIGLPEVAPLLIDVARRNPAVAVRAIYALSRIRCEASRSYLICLLENEDELARVSADQISRDELRIAAIRGLGTIGDDEAITSIRNFKDRLSPAQKIFLKNSNIQKAISEVLARH
ncbi:MAG TPA: HEAT repeat domain-containing protein [Candidatus Deferrimicrobium sp.]|nr:HEAT repeat domain-containing protein [Candidatus Deferrimicrobium sp.]